MVSGENRRWSLRKYAARRQTAAYWRLRNRFRVRGAYPALLQRVAEVARTRGRCAQPTPLHRTPLKFCETRPPPCGCTIGSGSSGDGEHHRQVVTFDDGYADNLHKTIAGSLRNSSNSFRPPDMLGMSVSSTDELDRLLPQLGTLPEALCPSVNGSNFTNGASKWLITVRMPISAISECFGEVITLNSRHSHRSLYQLLRPLPKTSDERC